MGEVVRGNFITTKDASPDQVIERAADYGLDKVVIVAIDKAGEFFFASSEADAAEVLYLLESAKWKLFKKEDEIRENGDPRGKPGRGA